jgi:hypothetical protein
LYELAITINTTLLSSVRYRSRFCIHRPPKHTLEVFRF